MFYKLYWAIVNPNYWQQQKDELVILGEWLFGGYQRA